MRSSLWFVSQSYLDRCIEQDQVRVRGQEATFFRIPGLPETALTLQESLYFLREIDGEEDQLNLVGTVRPKSEVVELGGDHCASSVIFPNAAYDVVEGFLLQSDGAQKSMTPSSHRPTPKEQEMDLLAQLLLKRTK